MNWIQLNNFEQLAQLNEESQAQPVLIFKHSTRCSISRASLDRLERNWQDAEMAAVKPYFLDLLNYRDLSSGIAKQYGIQHESPQVIIISKGEPVLDLSHFAIEYEEIRRKIKTEILQSA